LLSEEALYKPNEANYICWYICWYLNTN